MRGTLLLGIVLTAALQASAVADLIDDCRDSRQPGIRVNACITIIDSRRFDTNAKALAFQYLGDARSDAGAYQPAISDFNQAIRLQPNNAQAFAGRGRAKFSIGHLNGALSDFGKALSISPADPELYLQRGHVFLAHGNPASAIVDLNEAIRLNPNVPSAYNNRGLALRRKGENEAALRDYDTAIAKNPAFALAYANRAALREAMGARAAAVEDFQQALFLDPSLASARNALRRLGQESSAVRESEKRIRDGKELAERNCGTCHAVGPAGASANTRAPAFREIRKRHTMISLRTPISRAIAAPHEEMPNFAMSDQQIDTIIAYINSLAAKQR